MLWTLHIIALSAHFFQKLKCCTFCFYQFIYLLSCLLNIHNHNNKITHRPISKGFGLTSKSRTDVIQSQLYSRDTAGCRAVIRWTLICSDLKERWNFQIADCMFWKCFPWLHKLFYFLGIPYTVYFTAQRSPWQWLVNSGYR